MTDEELAKEAFLSSRDSLSDFEDLAAKARAEGYAQGLEAAAKVCSDIAIAKVGQEGEGMRARDPMVYEQGIGAEQCGQAIRAMIPADGEKG